MRIILILLFFCFLCPELYSQSEPSLSATEFNIISGSWNGEITYKDYSSGKSFSMPADVTIRQIGTSKNFIFFNSYPKEPNANSYDTVSISEDGKMLNSEMISVKNAFPNGDIEIITEVSGIDGNDNMPAVIRHTYLLGKNIFSKRKDVKFSEEAGWINRNLFTYSR